MYPLVSIIIPVYNAAPFLVPTVKGYLKQNYSRFEIILVDDGSLDNSRELIFELYQTHPEKIRVLTQDNAGPAKARNLGLSIAKGEYVCFFDADDEVDLNMLDVLVNEIKAGYDVVICGFRVKKIHDSRLISEYNLVPPRMSSDGAPIGARRLYCHLFLNGFINSPCNKIFRNSVIRENNLRFDERLRLTEDTNFVTEYFKFTNRILSINLPFYVIRRENRVSATRRYQANFMFIFEFYIQNLNDYLRGFTADVEISRLYNEIIVNWFWTVPEELCKPESPLSFSEKTAVIRNLITTPTVEMAIDEAQLSHGLISKTKLFTLKTKAPQLVLFLINGIQISSRCKSCLMNMFH